MDGYDHIKSKDLKKKKASWQPIDQFMQSKLFKFCNQSNNETHQNKITIQCLFSSLANVISAIDCESILISLTLFSIHGGSWICKQ